MKSYLIQTAANIIPLLVFFLVAKYETVEYFGYFSYLYAIYIIMTNIVDFGISSIGIREKNNNFNPINYLLIQLIIGVILGIAVIIFILSNLVIKEIIYIYLASVLNAIIPIWKYKKVNYSLIQLCTKFILLISAIIIIISKIDAYNFFIPLILAYSIINIICYSEDLLKIKLNQLQIIKTIQPLRHYATQHIIGFTALNITQIIIYHNLGPYYTGIYSLCEKITKPISFMAIPLRSILLFSKNKIDIINLRYIFALIIMLFILLFLAVIDDINLILLNNKYDIFYIKYVGLGMLINITLLILIEIDSTYYIYKNNLDAYLTKFTISGNILLILLTIFLVQYGIIYIILLNIINATIFILYIKYIIKKCL